MEPSEGTTDVVHPEVRAHINSLVSALGGFSADDDGRYVLGDSASEVLRDIKKWIRFYDEKTNRMDVARCLAEANIVDGDLLHILATWPENETNNKFRARAALACFEIMVPLTWPLERDRDQMTVNHHRHLPVLQLAQLGYKRAIINFDAAQILHTAVRVALPSMALSRSDRSGRDEGIIKLVLLFLRNVAMISPPPGVQYDGDESQISRSALIDAFSYQDILLTLLTIASNMGDDFNQEGVIVMEIIFHLVKRVDVTKLFMDEKQLGKAKSNELTAMMNKEAAMHRPYNRKAPSRHNRWGTMLWVDRGDGKVSTVTGQDALLDAATRQHKMDNSKVYRPPRRPRKEDMEPKDLGPPVSLNARARQQLKGFVEEFLDSSFNPLFQHVRKKIDEQKDYVFEYHSRQFFYLVSWFLEAERVRKKVAKDKAKDQKSASAEDVGSFNLVAGVLNQQTFITLNRAIGDALESKRWQELCAAMRCFTQILLTVQEMSESGNEDDEEIAENILARIFYEDETHDRIANIARDYKDQGFEYLDACTELTHTYLRVLEAYSKQNVDMQVRSRRRVRKKKKAANAAGEDEENPVEEGDDSENDQANAERTSRERKFDFNRFVNRFTPQGVVDTFVKFTKYYKDLDDTQLKRAHRYFYRIAFKQNMSVMLFRVDIIQLFYSMIKGQEPLDKASSMYKEWEELVKQILKKCIRKVEERPQLIIEMLFSKINATAHYLEYGYEKQTLSTTQSRPAAELEFRHLVDRDQQIAIAVGVLLDKNLADHVKWLKGQLSAAETERRAWEAAEKAMPSVEGPPVEGGEKKDANEVEKEGAKEGENEDEQQNTENSPTKEYPVISIRTDNDARRTAIFKNSHLRLLMKLVGIERLVPDIDETPESAWIIPSRLTPDQLKESVDMINKAEFNPPTFEDGKLAEDQLRRKTAPRKKAVFDDDEDGGIVDDDDEILFPAGGPTTRKVADAHLDKPKKTRRRRRKDSEAAELGEEELEEKERARREREKAKARRFKSELYVHASDDESDDGEDGGAKWAEFYANEERIRQRQQQVAAQHGAAGVTTTSVAKAEPVKAGIIKERKRKAEVLGKKGGESDGSSEDDDDLVLARDDDDEEEEDEDEDDLSSRSRKRGARDEGEDEDEKGGGADATDDTPLSSPGAGEATSAKRRRLSKEPSAAAEEEDVDMEDADDDVPSSKAPARRRRAGFVVESSDDEE